MEMIHDSRLLEYRNPYGAVTPETPIHLAIDLCDASDAAAVTLRIWADAKETLLVMRIAEKDDERTRYEVSFTPESEGTIWYHFIVAFRDGRTVRYGAEDGHTGGKGCMRDWEPPSFQITVHAPRAYPLAWYEPVSAYLSGSVGASDTLETMRTFREQYPADLYRDAFPWRLGDCNCRFEAWGDEVAPSVVEPTEDELLCFEIGEDARGFWCQSIEGETLCVLFNTSFNEPCSVYVPLVGEEVSELVAGYGLAIVEDAEATEFPKLEAPVAKRYVQVDLCQLGWAFLHFHDHCRLQREMEPGLGVLAHVTSLPTDDASREESGFLGESAKRFVDWLAEAGVRYWQVLPINPTDEYGSPYAGISAFAGNTRLLGEEEALGEIDLADAALREEYQEFCEREADWLEPYAGFMAIRQKVGEDLAWQKWPKRYRRYDASLIAADEELRDFAEACRRAQFAFDRRWRALRSYANEHNVLIIGDTPIYVSADSADVWAHPELFQLGPDGTPNMVAGCPPDAFAEEGQIWGNPVYDWKAHEASDYSWWLRRLERAFQLYDVLRLDHFIGFSRYFEIPADEKALAGSYRQGPGFGLFQRAFEGLGALPIVAEDLGLITPGVRSLSSACGFPGMDIAQFVDGNDPLGEYRPRPEKVAYTGTHDNQTLVGYCLARYPELDAVETAQEIARNVASCSASVAIVPLQDLAGLDDEARMNVPGVAEGNWQWEACEADLETAAPFVRELVRLRH